MTVKELTETLKQFDENKEVRIEVCSEPTKLIEITNEIIGKKLDRCYWKSDIAYCPEDAEDYEVVILSGEYGE